MRLTEGNLSVYIEGASHAPYLGVTIVGLPLGMAVDQEQVQAFVDKRRAKTTGDTPRREPDRIEWIKGIRDGAIVGDVEARIANTNVRSEDYSPYNVTPRPSHADYAAKAKYGMDYDVAGGGAFSGRMTAPMCIAGGLALQYLASIGVTLSGGITRIGKVVAQAYDFDEEGFPKERDAMLEEIRQAQAEQDSVGGEVTVLVHGVPAGWGDLMGDSIESRLSRAVFGVPAVKGVSFGAGFDLAHMRGSQANDPFAYREGKVVTLSNRSGGINGGLANGQDIVLHAAFRPTPSIGIEQRTVDLIAHRDATVKVGGRHDACIVRRGQYGVISAVAIALADIAIGEQTPTLASLRGQINSIDHQMRALFQKRMDVCRQVGEIKHTLSRPVYDGEREKQIVLSRTEGLEPVEKAVWGNVTQSIMRASRLLQGRYFLLGEKLPYTHSPLIHSTFGLRYGVKEAQADEIPAVLADPTFVGCNVTIPYKQTVIPYLDEVTGVARRLNAVNTIVKRADGKLVGYNTDYEGLRQTLLLAGIDLNGKVVAILGTGATSRTAGAVAEDMGAKEIVFVSRTKGVTYAETERYCHAQVVVNTTPVGTYPNVDSQAVDLTLFPRLEGVMDLTYNPLRTQLLQQAKGLGVKYSNGLPMLCIQAAESAKLWGAYHADWREAYKTVRKTVDNLVLIGMPAAGKTTLGKVLAERLGKTFADVDREIEAREGRAIPAIFAEDGEGYFRQVEKQVVKDLSPRGGKVIATGGGVVKDPDNLRALSKQGVIVWIKRDLAGLTGEGRPLSSSPEAIAKLYRERAPLYERGCDFAVTNEDIDQCVKEIIAKYEDFGA